MKKRGGGVGKWNGSGGKVGDHFPETVRNSAVREVSEELNLEIPAENLNLVGRMEFVDLSNKDFTQTIDVFVVEEWDGEPTESEEMRPKWFKVEDIPYDDMWEDDKYWLPLLLKGSLFKGKSVFKGYDMVEQNFECVDSLEEFKGEFTW